MGESVTFCFFDVLRHKMIYVDRDEVLQPLSLDYIHKKSLSTPQNKREATFVHMILLSFAPFATRWCYYVW
jgi:hypothetical protein